MTKYILSFFAALIIMIIFIEIGIDAFLNGWISCMVYHITLQGFKDLEQQKQVKS